MFFQYKQITGHNQLITTCIEIRSLGLEVIRMPSTVKLKLIKL